MLGKLTWSAIPLDQPIPLVAAGLVGLVIAGVLGWVVLKGHLPYLWREWITSVDHKRVGVMYCLLALVMLLRGFVDALMMRSQQALAYRSDGYLPPDHYDQIGVHLVFFLHIGTVPDSTNNILALAFGVLIVFLLIAGSLWIMGHLNHNMMTMDQLLRMQR